MYKKRQFFLMLILFVSISLFLTSASSAFSKNQAQCIRFHVIANSDSKEDQEMKLKVRDRLLSQYGHELAKISNLEDSRYFIEEKINEVEDLSQAVVDEYRQDYRVEALLGNFDFPTKVYGDKLWPAGNYEALRIIIGEGRGANWWCVMFPPLCFVDISHGITQEEDPDDEENLTVAPGRGDPEIGEDSISEKAALNRTKGDTETVKETEEVYKFKIVEWWEKAKELLWN